MQATEGRTNVELIVADKTSGEKSSWQAQERVLHPMLRLETKKLYFHICLNSPHHAV